MTDAPQYEHDGCDHCQFVGRWDERDVWACPQAGMPTVIVRRSADPPDYESGRRLLHTLPPALFDAAIAAVPALGIR
jgi:hypothetical protein